MDITSGWQAVNVLFMSEKYKSEGLPKAVGLFYLFMSLCRNC
jgi:hypothetical protein